MWLWPSTPRSLSARWIAYNAEAFLLSVCAVIPCQNTRNTAFVLIRPPPACGDGRKLTVWTVQIKESQETADAPGGHEGERPLGAQSHQVHERHIGQSHQQKSNTHHWIALRKEGWVGSPTANLPPLRGWPPFPHQHRALPIITEIILTEHRVRRPMVRP